MSAAPYYFTTGQTELVEFYESLIPQLELPVLLYNMPSHTKVSFAPSTVKKIAKNDKLLGLKDSSANGSYFQSIMYEMRDHKDFLIFVGPEEMLAASVLLGASGGVNGGANLFPKLYVELYNAAIACDMPKVKELHEKVMYLCSTIYTVGSYSSSYLKGMKCALSLKGICSDVLASPFTKFDNAHRKMIKSAIDAFNF